MDDPATSSVIFPQITDLLKIQKFHFQNIFKNIHTNFHENCSINGFANRLDTEVHLTTLDPYPLLGVGAKLILNTFLASAN